jgi:hypothetical protein
LPLVALLPDGTYTAVVFNPKLCGARRDRILAAAQAGAELDPADGSVVRVVEFNAPERDGNGTGEPCAVTDGRDGRPTDGRGRADPSSLPPVSTEDRAVPSLPRAPALAEVDPHIGGTNSLAVASFVCALVGCTGIGVPLAIIFGHVALVQIRRYGQDGAGLAVTGLVVGYLSLAFWLLMIVIIRTTPG